jgi:hypothetical protein
MPQHIFITGEAGSGKTRMLMERAAAIGSATIKAPHQRVLAIALMHGARRRLQSTLDKFCPNLPVTVLTIHSFALGVVNRWRRSLGITLPVTVCETTCGLAEANFRARATFDEVIQLASKALQSETVCRTLGETYPIIIVDEFQDCAAETLRFVLSLGNRSTLLLAADRFQRLVDKEGDCPAVDWAEARKLDGGIEYVDLTGCRRTENDAILRAARALRDNVKAAASTVPVYFAPNVGPAAYRMVERFLPWANAKVTCGSYAVIVLSLEDPLLTKLIKSFQDQLAKRNPNFKVQWILPLPEKNQLHQLLTELGIDPAAKQELTWDPHRTKGTSQATRVARRVVEFAKLRGIAPIPQELAIDFAALAVHNSRAFSRSTPRFQVLTAHGAKNREFHHVFVFWAYKGEKWTQTLQRRLLYNAITRAKLDCTVLVLGNQKRTQTDPVISLLGPAIPAIDPAWTQKKKARPLGSAVAGRSA